VPLDEDRLACGVVVAETAAEMLCEVVMREDMLRDLDVRPVEKVGRDERENDREVFAVVEVDDLVIFDVVIARVDVGSQLVGAGTHWA
jgi:hypothetical protein